MKVRIALATLAGAAMLATAGVAAMAPSAGASTVPATTVSHVTYPPAPRGCTGWQLSATLTRGYQTWGNHRELVLTLTNTSRSACTVSGYPGLQLLTSRYQPLPTTTVPVTVRFPSANPIVLLPGRSVTADITFTVYGLPYPWNHIALPIRMASAAYLVVTMPNSHTGYWGYWQHFVLKIPGGPVRILQDRLYETPLMGQFPIFW